MIKNTLKEFSFYALTVSMFIMAAFVVNNFYLQKEKEPTTQDGKPSSSNHKTQEIFHKIKN